MAWRPWFMMICGGPETRHGPRGSGSFTHGRLGLGSSCLGFKRPCSSGLLLALVLLSIPVASGVVCNTCKDTITGCIQCVAALGRRGAHRRSRVVALKGAQPLPSLVALVAQIAHF